MAEVDLNSRYNSAWLETTTRITQRQNSLYIFLVIGLGISAFAFDSKTPPDMPLVTKALLAAAIPGSGIILGWLNQKHDDTIALLRHFMAECEMASSDKTLERLSYNANPLYRAYADRYRANHNRAFAWSIGLMSAMGLALFIFQVAPFLTGAAANLDTKTLIPMILLYFIGYVAAAFAAIVRVHRQPELHYIPLIQGSRLNAPPSSPPHA